MKRSRRLLLAGVAVALVAAVSGALVAIGLGDDNQARLKPTGTRTVIRIEPVDGTVSCGPGGAAAYIYLDDLEFRPSPNDASVAYGVAGWQLALEYDPAVLRIANPTDIELNPQLSQEDADADGIARSYFPLANLDDAAGLALIGAASLVAGGGDLSREEGVDPVARGEPLLLATVRFQTAGRGTTTLTLGDPGRTLNPAIAPGIYDNESRPYEPLVFTDATITVEGGDCPEVVLNTPLPTVRKTSTPFVEPTWTPVPWRTVEPIDAPAAGRDDCPTDWAAYTDPQDRFSICYPGDFGASASDFAVNATSGEDRDGVAISFAVGWNAAPGTVYYPPSAENCSHYLIVGRESAAAIDLATDDRTVTACFLLGVTEGAPGTPIGSVQGAIPVANDGSERDGFVQFQVGLVGSVNDTLPALVGEILRSLVVGPR